MNKNYLFILIAVTIAVILIIVFSLMSATMTLDQIIKNKDCTALSKWEEEHMFDDDSNVSSEQLSDAMSLATECVGKVIGNMFGTSDISPDTTDPILVLDEILKKRDCDGLNIWGSDHILTNKDVTLNNKQQLNIDKLIQECGSKELKNFLRESDLSTNTLDPMIVLGKILNNRDCDGLAGWLKDYNDLFKNLRAVIFIEVLDFKSECKIK